MNRALILLSSFFFLLTIDFLPLPIPPYLDFQVIYQADMGLLRGISIYDRAGQVNMIAQLANVPPEQVYVLPFPYPPWYALAVLPLALLPIQIAARLWFEINLVMLILSIGLMTDGWQTRKRLWIGLAAIFFLPALGTLLVGQYVIPVLFGAALWIHAARKENAALITLGSAFLTFKPHLGALILLAGIVYLLSRRDDFTRKTLIYMLVAGIILFALGFLADSAWPINYIRSLLAFSKDSGVASCGLCASLPVALVSIFNGESSLTPAPLIGLMILTALLSWLGLSRRVILKDPHSLITIAILITLLSSPYLLNYDFLLLLVSFLFLAKHGRASLEWALIAAAYLIPFVALGIWGRQGNIGFSLSAIILLIQIYRDTHSLDDSHQAAYNPAAIK